MTTQPASPDQPTSQWEMPDSVASPSPIILLTLVASILCLLALVVIWIINIIRTLIPTG